MPNIKSQKKRAVTNLKANAANKALKSELKSESSVIIDLLRTPQKRQRSKR